MATKTAVSLKLHIVVDKKKNKVLFAEAGKDFVDFIFHILYLPLGAVSRILSETSNLGSLGTLQEGLKNLDPEYFGGKKHLLDIIKAPYRGKQIPQLLPEASFSKPHTLYRCRPSSNSYLDTYVEEPCGNNWSRECCDVVPIPGSLKDVVGSEEAYLSNIRLVMFMVMDDLKVRASVATGGISLLDELSVKDIGAIEKREVSFGTKEAIKLLKASLSSKTVLTDVFLAGGGAVKAEN